MGQQDPRERPPEKPDDKPDPRPRTDTDLVIVLAGVAAILALAVLGTFTAVGPTVSVAISAVAAIITAALTAVRHRRR
jgi:hypothetical protein